MSGIEEYHGGDRSLAGPSVLALILGRKFPRASRRSIVETAVGVKVEDEDLPSRMLQEVRESPLARLDRRTIASRAAALVISMPEEAQQAYLEGVRRVRKEHRGWDPRLLAVEEQDELIYQAT